MENIPQSAKSIACDFFLDVELLCIVRDEAVFDFGEQVRVVRLDSNTAQVGEVGRLALFHTQHGERWQFRPYKSNSWRRVPDLDTPSCWAWRCVKTGGLTITAVGSVPNHASTAPRPPEAENDFPFN